MSIATTKSEHVSRLKDPAKFRDRCSRSGVSTRSGDLVTSETSLSGSFDRWNKKMGGALDVPGLDLSPRRGERGRTLDPSVPFPLRYTFGPFSSPCASHLTYNPPLSGDVGRRTEETRTRRQVDENGQPSAACAAATHDGNIKRSLLYGCPDKGKLLLLLALLSTSSSMVVE